jgi:hypothetical protein
VFIILWALIILVRFYIFEGYWYTLFTVCMLLSGDKTFDPLENHANLICEFDSGLIFNVSSINLFITDFTYCDYILPFVIGLPITITWTVVCIFMPIFKPDIFSQFSFMPIAVYHRQFYEGLSYDPENKTMHEFTRRFMRSNFLFDNSTLVLIILCFAGSKFRGKVTTFRFYCGVFPDSCLLFVDLAMTCDFKFS